MWLVSKPPSRQTLAALGLPGNGVLLQSANAHRLLGMVSRASPWCTRRVKVAPALSRLAASYAGGAGIFTVATGAVRRYSARTRPITGEPSRLTATGSA